MDGRKVFSVSQILEPAGLRENFREEIQILDPAHAVTIIWFIEYSAFTIDHSVTEFQCELMIGVNQSFLFLEETFGESLNAYHHISFLQLTWWIKMPKSKATLKLLISFFLFLIFLIAQMEAAGCKRPAE